MPRQVPLPFPLPALDLPTLTVEGQAAGRRTLSSWLAKPAAARDGLTGFTLVGPPGAGKTRVLRDLCQTFGGDVLADPGALTAVSGPGAHTGPLALDDAHRASPADIMAVFNAGVSTGRAILITGRGPVSTWGGGPADTGFADAKSRLAALAAAAIAAPTEDDLAAALGAALDGFGLRIGEAACRAAVPSLRRSYWAVVQLAEAVATLAKERDTPARRLVADALAQNPSLTLT